MGAPPFPGLYSAGMEGTYDAAHETYDSDNGPDVRPDVRHYWARFVGPAPLSSRDVILRQFLTHSNLAALRSALKRAIPRGPARRHALATAENKARAFVQGGGAGDALDADPVARRGAAQRGVDPAPELQRLNRVFLGGVVRSVRDLAPGLAGGPAGPNLSYAEDVLVHTVLGSSGPGGFNPSPVYGPEEDQVVGCDAQGGAVTKGDAWRGDWEARGGTRFMRYTVPPVWRRKGNAPADRDIGCNLGAQLRETDNPVRRAPFFEMALAPAGQPSRLYGARPYGPGCGGLGCGGPGCGGPGCGGPG